MCPPIRTACHSHLVSFSSNPPVEPYIALQQWPKRARTKTLKSKFHDRKLVACDVAALGEQEFMSIHYLDDVLLVKLKCLIRDRNNGNAVGNGTASE